MLKELDWKEHFEKADLRYHWRIAVCIISCAVLGPLIIPLIVLETDSFALLWTGLVIGLMTGLLLGSAWQLSEKNRWSTTSGRLLVVSGSAWLLLSIFGIFMVNLGIQEHSHKMALIASLKQKIADGPIEISILPFQLSEKRFEYKISDSSEIQKFTDAVKNANAKPTSGHSGPIFECTLIIKNSSGNFRYLASVHKYDRPDLFLSDQFYKETRKGIYSGGPTNLVRIPGIGNWIMSVAPEGRL